MNKRFSVINKRGLVFSAAIMGIFGILSGVSLAKMLSGSSNFWLLGVIVFVTLMIISALVITLVVTAGVEVKSNMVILPDPDPKKGKTARFNLDELSSIDLQDGDGKVLDPDKDSLIGARVIFHLKDGRQEQYYPVKITKKQYKSIETGMMNLSNELKNDELFDD